LSCFLAKDNYYFDLCRPFHLLNIIQQSNGAWDPLSRRVVEGETNQAFLFLSRPARCADKGLL